jgi:NHL repeat
MTRKWWFIYSGALLAALIIGLGLWSPLKQAKARGRPETPQYRVDPFWPKPLPSDATHLSSTTGKPKPWVTADVGGTCVDSHDRIWTVNRAFQATATAPNQLVAPETVIAVAAPPAIAYDRNGDVFTAWGNPNVVPSGIHGCFVDYQDNVWIGGNGDGIVQKYAQDGTLLMQIGTRGKCDWPANNNACGNSANDPGANKSHTLLNEPADLAVDPSNGDVYIADGYGNHRIVVFDKRGNWLRHWGGVVVDTLHPNLTAHDRGSFTAGDGGHPHCAVLARNGNLYVCDRGSDRILVYERNPTNCDRSTDPPVCQPLQIINVLPGTGVTAGPGGIGLGRRLLQRPRADLHVRGGRRQRDPPHHGPRLRSDARRDRPAGPCRR